MCCIVWRGLGLCGRDGLEGEWRGWRLLVDSAYCLQSSQQASAILEMTKPNLRIKPKYSISRHRSIHF